MTLTRPKALLFDWDNTLVDTWAVIHHALVRTFEAMGHEPWTLEETRGRVRQSARETFPLLFGARADEAMAIFYNAFGASHLQQLRQLAGAKDLLDELSAAGYLLGVVSNKKGLLLRREAEHLGWNGYFHRLVGANDAPRDKPAPDVVALALEGSGLAAGAEVWFVGDTDIDLQCAHVTGCVPVLLRPEPPAEGEFADYPPDLYIESCGALAKRLSAT